MADETETQTETPNTEVAQQTEADPVEEKLDRIVAQRLGKYAERTRTAEAEAGMLRERVARLEGQAEKAKATPAVYTVQQLQAAVDAGQISPALMADQIAWQRTEQAKREVRQEFVREQKVGTASNEIHQYTEKVPALLDSASDEYRRVYRAAAEIAEELDRPVTDPIVQRRALREVLGGLDKVAAVKAERQFDRANADTHAEAGGGGAPVKGGDPLKHIDPVRMAFWKQRGYTREQMIEEAKYVTRPVRSRA